MSAVLADIGQAAKRRLRVIVESYYDVLDQRIRTDHRVRNYAEHGGLIAVLGDEESYRLQRAGVQEYKKAIKDLKFSDKEEKEIKRIGGIENYKAKDEPDQKRVDFFLGYLEAEKELDGWHQSMNKVMSGQEAYLKRLAMGEIADHPLWTEWLQYVYGIGPCLAGGLLSWVDIRRCDHVSQLWKYAGQAVKTEKWTCRACGNEIPHHPSLRDDVKCPKCANSMQPIGAADRRVKGEKTGYNPRLKTHCFKIAESFVKQNAAKSGYRRLYDQFRAKVDSEPCNKVHLDEKTKKPIPCFDAHKFAKAKRLVIKVFLAHCYLKWRGIVGLPTSDPYVFGMMAHDKASYIEPIFDIKPEEGKAAE
jgi:hypothetical protein